MAKPQRKEFNLRIDKALHALIAKSARTHKRSINAEITARLQHALDMQTCPKCCGLGVVLKTHGDRVA